MTLILTNLGRLLNAPRRLREWFEIQSLVTWGRIIIALLVLHAVLWVMR